MRKLIFVLSVFVLLFAACSDPAQIIQKEMNTGIDNLYKGRYSIAAKHFRKVLELDSTSSEAHHNLGLVFFNQQKYDQAMSEYNRAIHFDPKNGQAYKSRAQLWFIMGDRDKSCADYIKAEDLGVKNLSNYTRHCR
jgi:Tfp pilus assembly protein PilF